MFNNDPGSSPFLSLFAPTDRIQTISLEVVALVASIMPLLGVFQVFDGIAAITAGILRARGKQVRWLASVFEGVFAHLISASTVFGRIVESYVSLLRFRVVNRLIRSLRM